MKTKQMSKKQFAKIAKIIAKCTGSDHLGNQIAQVAFEAVELINARTALLPGKPKDVRAKLKNVKFSGPKTDDFVAAAIAPIAN